jgi:hypothetical protein
MLMVAAQRRILHIRQWRQCAWLVSGLFLFASAGCRPGDEISRVTEPRDDFGKREAAKGNPAAEAKIPTRLLAVIAPAPEGQSWFFKLMGPAELVGRQESAFDAFVSSIKFTDQQDKQVTWVLPEGWREGPKKPIRYATILPCPEDDTVELAVTLFGGGLLENVNRWRVQQLGLEAVKQDQLDTVCREVQTIQGKKVMRVDLSGMAPKGPVMPPFMKGR